MGAVVCATGSGDPCPGRDVVQTRLPRRGSWVRSLSSPTAWSRWPPPWCWPPQWCPGACPGPTAGCGSCPCGARLRSCSWCLRQTSGVERPSDVVGCRGSVLRPDRQDSDGRTRREGGRPWTRLLIAVEDWIAAGAGKAAGSRDPDRARRVARDRHIRGRTTLVYPVHRLADLGANRQWPSPLAGRTCDWG